MNPSLPSPDRRTPAGSGHPSPGVRLPIHGEAGARSAPGGDAGDLLVSMAPDMERALGALRDFTRRDILLRFYSDRKARTVEDVARATGIHRSVAFDHLERLVALGYLEVERRRGLPGKPAKIYRLTAGPLQISHPMRRYDVLAEALARAFEGIGSDGGRVAIKHVGRRLGRAMARPQSAGTGNALEPLVEMGADYEAGRGGRLECTNCLFAEVCRRAPIVCSFHAGVLEGITGRDGLTSRIESLGFLGPGGCAYLVRA